MPANPDRLRSLLEPHRTAVVTMELQRGVVGDLATIPDLAEEVRRRGTLAAVGRLLAGARSAGAHVVHATVAWRADRAGTPTNTPLVAALSRNPDQVLEGTPAVELVPELGAAPTDVACARRHGLTPFPGTDLDATLRALGATTVVATGVSLNVGVLGLCLGAADLGYRVVVPTDCVAGVPAAYAEEVLRHTLAVVATLTTADDVLAAWR